jgi:uncharacterized protein (DUF885 family)
MHATLIEIGRIAAAAAALSVLPAFAQPAAERLHKLAEEMIEREFDLAPARETYAEGAGPRAGRAVADLSPDVDRRYRALYRSVLEAVKSIPPSELGERDRTNLALLERRAAAELEYNDFPLRAISEATPIRNPVNLLIRVGASAQPLATEADFETWLARVEASAGTMDQAIALLRAAAEKDWTSPRALVEATLKQVEPVAAKPAREGPFWDMVAKYPAAAGAGKRAAFEKRYAAALEAKLLPAIGRYAKFLREEYLPKARTTSGIGSLPGGERAYRARIRNYTTLDLPPGQVHELGLKEVARIQPKLLEVARKLGFNGEMRELSAWITSNPGNYPFRSGEDVLAYLRRAHARVEPELPKLFRRLPRARFEIHLTPAAVAASASATYSRPSADGTRPGIFHVPVADPASYAAFGLTALLMHEGMPGHHLDIARMVELDLPRFRKVHSVTVYSEGWGLYAESLGHELGMYDDPWALLGRYSAELHRAARLVVDTGLHSRGWSREQAIRYLVEERGAAERSATVAVERYMSDPGQALAYKVGEIEIRKLRAEAARKLGARFDLRDFHEAVLGEGALSLDLLRTRVRAWITRVK